MTTEKAERNISLNRETAVFEGNAPYVFLSYSHSDIEKVQTDINLLKKNNCRFWFDKGIGAGSDWADCLSEKIEKCEQFIVYLSSKSANSIHLKNEVHKAVKYGKKILVVYLEDFELTGGLELELGRIQAIRKFDNGAYDTRLLYAISPECIEVDFSDNKEKEEIGRYVSKEIIDQKRYRLISKAKDSHTGHTVIIKQAVRDGSVLSEEAVYSILREKEVLDTVKTPFIPALVDYYEENGNIFLIESYIEGGDSSRTKYCSVSGAVRSICSVAKALKYVHDTGYIHGDVTPSNIIESKFGDAVLIDFGASQRIGEVPKYKFGTPGFFAPELSMYSIKSGNSQEKDRGADTKRLEMRTTIDIYGLGRTLYYFLTHWNYGTWEIGTDDERTRLIEYDEILENKITELIEDDGLLDNKFTDSETEKKTYYEDERYFQRFAGRPLPDLMDIDRERFDPELNRIIHKMTDPMPEKRYQSIDELLHELEAYIERKKKKGKSLRDFLNKIG